MSAVFAAFALALTGSPAMADADLVVSPAGPVRTLNEARDAVRALRRGEPGRRRPILVLLRGGAYELAAPVVFTPEDSGTPAAPVIYAAWPGERPLLSGGRRLTDWRDEGGRWSAPVESGWTFAQLFVNGERRFRPRVPKRGYALIAHALAPSAAAAGKGFDRIAVASDDLPPALAHPEEVEALVFHNWFMSRMRIKEIDRRRGIITFTGPTGSREEWGDVRRGRCYLLDNVAEALTEPGEWRLDPRAAVVTYLPRPGESAGTAEVVAPRLERLIELRGDPVKRRWVEHLVFRGLTFAHTSYVAPPEGYSCLQAESELGAAVSGAGARHCALEECEIAHTGAYAVAWGEGCRDDRVERCALHDLGAGGVKIGSTRRDPETDAAGIVVRDCVIAHGGRIHPAAVGVWIGHAAGNTIEHNDIHDLYYTAISVGWNWGYGESGAHHNRIAFNRISVIGQRVLTDMGGVYTLGLSPGTVVAGNVISDVDSYDYGGWGIYFDEGSTGVVAEDNLVYRTKSGGFHQHYGRDNVVRNNIFALAREGQLIRTRAEAHRSFTLSRNLVLADGAPLLGGDWSGTGFELQDNLYWDAKGAPAVPKQGTDWVIADPRFRDPQAGDFRLAAGSPAARVGFKPFDPALAGPRGTPPMPPDAPAAYPPGDRLDAGALPVAEDFEEVAPGEKTPDASTYEDHDRGTARVAEGEAAGGRRALRFVKADPVVHEYNPHMYYSCSFTSGTLLGSFAARVEPGRGMAHEWRQVLPPGSDPWYRTGPSLRVDGAGALTAGGQPLGRVPSGRWTRYEIRYTLGSTTTFDLTVTPAGARPERHPGLPCAALARLDWYGFTAMGKETGVQFHLDDIALHREPGRGGTPVRAPDAPRGEDPR